MAPRSVISRVSPCFLRRLAISPEMRFAYTKALNDTYVAKDLDGVALTGAEPAIA